MHAIDLTHTIAGDTPVYPGTDPPRIRVATTIDRDGFRESELTLFSHVGTHMDAPAHLFEDGLTLDAYGPDAFCGRALALDVGQVKSITLGDLPDPAVLKTLDYLLFKTGWDRHWGEDAYFEGYPILTPEAARYLTTFSLKGIGLDALSVDPVTSLELPIHRILLGAGLLIVENLRGLYPLDGAFSFFALPLNYQNADGAPVRAIATT